MHNFWFASVKPALQKSVVFQTEICCYNKTFWFFPKLFHSKTFQFFPKLRLKSDWKDLMQQWIDMRERKREREREPFMAQRNFCPSLALKGTVSHNCKSLCCQATTKKGLNFAQKKFFLLGCLKKCFLVWNWSDITGYKNCWLAPLHSAGEGKRERGTQKEAKRERKREEMQKILPSHARRLSVLCLKRLPMI